MSDLFCRRSVIESFSPSWERRCTAKGTVQGNKLYLQIHTLYSTIKYYYNLRQKLSKGSSLSFNPPPPVHPLPNVVLEIRKNTERKVDIIVTTLKQGKLSKVGMSKITSKDVLTLFRLGFLRVVQLGGGGGGARGL